MPPGGEDDFVTLEPSARRRRSTRLATTPRSVPTLRAIDTERGAKVSGSRFYFLTGIGAQLEFALVTSPWRRPPPPA